MRLEPVVVVLVKVEVFLDINTVLTDNWLPVGNIYVSVHSVSSQKTSLEIQSRSKYWTFHYKCVVV